MIGRLWRWPISSALRERFSSNEIATGFVGSMSRCCEPLSGVVPPHLAAISTNAPTADIVPPSRTTAAGTAIARSVRLPLGNGGSRRVGENSSRRPTPISCSPCPVAWRHWSCRTRRSSMIFCFLHTWSQQLKLHPHVHCVAPAGGLSPDRARWVGSRKNYFLPKKVLRKVFRGKFVNALKQAFQDGLLRFEGNLKLLAKPKIFAAWLRPLYRQDWVVYLKPPFGGPAYVLQYLGRYTHRVAISNHRLVSFIDGQVTFRWRDSAHHNKQKLLP